MREKTVSVRFAAVGGDALKADMRGIGLAGRESMAAVRDSAERATSGIEGMSSAAAQARAYLEQIEMRSHSAAYRMQPVLAPQSDIQARINQATGVSTGQSAAATLAQGQAMDDLRAKINPLYAAIRQYKQSVAELRASELSGVISTNEAAEAKSRLRTSALAAIDKIKGLSAAQKESARAAEEAARAHAAEAQRLDDLRAKYNPVYGVIRQYQAQKQELRGVYEAGKISVDEYNASLSRLRQSSLNSIAAYKGQAEQIAEVSRASRTQTFQNANIAAQLNDIGVMMAAGQNPMMLAIQQGTQLNQIWATMGSGKDILRGLAAGFMSMVNPMSIATIGIIALGAAAVNWFTKADEKAKTLKDTMSDLSSSVRSYASAVDKSLTSTVKLNEEFGSGRVRAQALYDVLERLARLDAMDKIQSATSKMSEEYEDLSDRMAVIASYQRQGEMGGDTVLVMRRQARLLNEEFGVTIDQGEKINAAMQSLAAAVAPEDVQARAAALNALFVDLFGSLEKTPKPLQDMARNVAQAELAALQFLGATLKSEGQIKTLEGSTDRWARSMSSVLAEVNGIRAALADLGGGLLSRAAKGVELQALKAGKSLAEASAAGRRFEINTEYDKKVADAGNAVERIALEAARRVALSEIKLDQELSAAQAAARERERESRKSGGGTAKQREEVQELIGSLQSELAVMRETDPVKARLLSLSEQMAGATDAERKAIMDLVEEQDRVKHGWEGVKKALGDYAEDSKRIGDDIGDAFKGAFTGAEAAIRQFAMTGKMEFRELVQSLLADLAVLTAKKGILGPLSDALSNSIGGAGNWLSDIIFNANGNAISNGRVIPFANGGVVTGPTLFPMQNGTGLMGEAGPEGIFPLKRTPDGKLGIRATGSGKSEQQVVVRLVLDSEMLNAQIMDKSQMVAVSVTKEFSRSALPGMVKGIIRDPRKSNL